MKEYIRERVLQISQHVADTGATVRQAAEVFGVSKSTVHKDVTERLPKINPELAQAVRDILDFNKSVRHLRGGEATRKKYLSADGDELAADGDADGEADAPVQDRAS